MHRQIAAAIGLAAALAAVWAPAGRAQSASAPTTRQLERTWSRRFARAEAVDRLVEQVRRLPTGGGMKVGEFLSSSPRLEMALRARLLGLADGAGPKYSPDGTCEVTLGATAAEVTAALKAVHARHYRRGRFAAGDFDAIGKSFPGRRLQARGRATAPSILTAPVTIALPAGDDPFDRVDRATRRFWRDNVTAVGRRRAERTARQDAIRRLARQIGGVRIAEGVTLAELAGARTPAERARLVRGTLVRSICYHRNVPLVEARVEVRLATAYAGAKSSMLTGRAGAGPASRPAGLDRTRAIALLEKLIVASRGKVRSEIGVGCPPEDELKRRDAGLIAAVELASAAPEWVGRSLHQKGLSAGLGRGDAVSAAEADARDRLAEKLARLPVADDQTIGEIVEEIDGAARDVLAVLAGARRVGAARKAADGSVEVTVRVRLLPLWRLLLRWRRQ